MRRKDGERREEEVCFPRETVENWEIEVPEKNCKGGQARRKLRLCCHESPGRRDFQ